MGFRDYIQTIEDMERLYYSNLGAQFVQKDAPIISTTTGVYNAIYGAQVWSQLNHEANVFGALPKFPHTKSGWRIITVRPAASGGGVAQNAALPATTKPTFLEVTTLPKTIAHNFDTSEVQEFLAAESDDDAFGALAQMRPIMGTHHKEMINIMLLSDFDTVVGDNIDSIDRVCSSASEETAVATAADMDMYGIDRSAHTYYDAYVSHASGVDRSLTDLLIRTLNHNVGKQGGNTTFYSTGHDTYSSVQGVYDSYVRYTRVGEADFTVGVNGISTDKGIGVGIRIATLFGLPLIVSKNTHADTISRLYALDTSDPEGFGQPRLGIRIAKPTQYFEAGMLTGDPFGINRLGTEGMYRTMGELICTHFPAQGKIRDLE